MQGRWLLAEWALGLDFELALFLRVFELDVVEAIVCLQDSVVSGVLLFEISQVYKSRSEPFCLRLNCLLHVDAALLKLPRLVPSRLQFCQVRDSWVKSWHRKVCLSVIKHALLRNAEKLLGSWHLLQETNVLHPRYCCYLDGVFVDVLKSWLIKRIKKITSWTHHFKFLCWRIFCRLNQVTLVQNYAETCRIFILNHMVKFTFKNGLVSVTLSLPIFNVKLFYAWLLLFEWFHGNLLTTWKIYSVVVFTRFLARVDLRDALVNRFPKLFNVQI